MLMKAEQSVLVLIDLQEKLMPAIHRGETVVDRCATLATIARLLSVPVLATVRIPANVTGHSGHRDRFAHGHHAGVGFVL